jgi:cobalamin-dependent methionine synthase I
MQGRTISTDDVTTHYFEAGVEHKGRKPSVLLLHSAEFGGCAETSWEHNMPVLAQRYHGSRYSFGYPACPNMQDQYKLLHLLDAKRVDLVMDESEQLYPEQSTTALIVHHSIAKYFSA